MMHDVDLTKQTSPIDAFHEAVHNCSPGTKIIYHRGEFLAGSRLARMALKAFEAGQVELVQRRDARGGNSFFEFIAVKKREPKPSLRRK